MSKGKIESMINFQYFVKLRKTKKRSATEFFYSFFSSQIPRKTHERIYRFNILRYKDINPYSSEEILIQELEKPIINETVISELPPSKINNYLNNSNNQEKLDRNINTMLNIFTKNKISNRYFIYNNFDEKLIRLLAAFATHEFHIKSSCIYSNNAKPNACYYIIRGKISLRTFNPEKIKNENNRNKYKFLSIYNNIETEDKINGRYFFDEEDKMSLDNFVSKTNIITNQQDDHTVSVASPAKRKSIKLIVRRSFTRDPNLFKKEFNQNPKKIVEDRILNQNLNELQRNLSCEIKSFGPGQFFGEWDLILDKPHQETAYADENTDLLVLHKKFFDKYFLKHMLKIDSERRLFLTKRIEFLHINNVMNLKPEFYDKDTIIYTQFDFAREFFIIYKGRGALKIIKNNNCKKKSEVIFHKNDMKTICFVDKGCVVGLETCKEGGKKYDNNFVIIEDDTILYRMRVRGANEDNSYLKKKNRLQLKQELDSLYSAQKKFLPRTNIEAKTSNKEELQNHKNQDKINNIFHDARDYFRRNLLNNKKMNMNIKAFISNINDLKNNNYNNLINNHKKIIGKINLTKTMTSDWNLKRRKSFSRNNNLKFFNPKNKNHKETLTFSSLKEKEEEPSNKNLKTINTFKNLNSMSLFSNNSSEHSHLTNKLSIPKKKFTIYKNIIINRNAPNDKKYMTLKNLKSPICLTEQTVQTDKGFNSLDMNNDNINNKCLSTNNINKLDKLLKDKKRTKKKEKFVLDKYIAITARISKENNINYNSGYFKMPLIGLNRRNYMI